MRKLFALLLLVGGVAWGRHNAHGFCEQGAIAVVTAGIPSSTTVQGSYPSCTITVFLTGTSTLATLFSDNMGTSLSNPFTANTSGFWLWYADNNRYDVQLSGGGLPSPWKITDILLFDPTAGTPAVTSVSAGPGISVTGPTTTPTVNNTGVLSFTAGTGISNTGTAANPIATNTGVLSVGGQTGALSAQGNGTKVQLSTGTTTSNDCVKFDANGNTVDLGTTCNNFALPAGTQTQYLQLTPNTSNGNSTTPRFNSLPTFNVADYVFPAYSCNVSLTCSQGGTSAGSIAVGNNTLTFTPVPLGVNGTDLYHRLYFSGGTGTAEGCLISGGTGLSGQASGQIIVNCANTHTGAFTIVSIDGSIQEAVQAATTAGGGYVFVPPGTYTATSATQVQSGITLGGVAGQTIIKAANQVLARNAQWQNANQAGPYYCMVCAASGSTNVIFRDFTIDENGLNQTYVYFSGDAELHNTNNSRIENITVQNRMGSLAGGGTGVGIGVYASTYPPTNYNNVVDRSFVDAHPGGCSVPNGGGAFYIEGLGTRITNSHAKDVCDVAFVVSSCQNCVVANSVGDIGAGQMSTPTFSVEGAVGTEFNSNQCVASGTNAGRYCVGIDSASGHATNIQSSGTRVINVAAAHHTTTLEIGLQFSLFGVALAVLDTDIIGIQSDTGTVNDCIVLSNYVIKVSIIGGVVESCGGSGVSIVSTGTGVGTTVTNVVIDGFKSDHAVNAGVICNNGSGGTNACVIGLKIVNSFLGDTNGTPRQLRGIWFQTPATDVYIAGNTTTGVTSNSVLFQGALTNAFIGNNTTTDTANMSTAVTLGAAVASATAITMTGPIFHVTGTTAINTINGGSATGGSVGMGTCITIIPDGLWTTVTGGNIALGTTAVVSKQLIECFDSTTNKWYPSY